MTVALPLIVRAATSGDVEAIADINVKAWQLAYRGIMSDSYLEGLEQNQAVAAQRHRDRIDGQHGPPTFELVAEHDGAVVGWLRAGPTRDDDRHESQGEIWAVYVHPQVWRAGVGSALMTAALARLASDGYTEATLWVFEENARARLFYERFGWTADGGTEFFERSGRRVIEIRYHRPL
jgi:ribosomal protein S18 acetylase RimI-like enzyme